MPLPSGHWLGVLHYAWQSSAPTSGPSLAGADGRHIPCWGERLITVTIGGVPRQWRFLLAAVSFPILGVDFLRHHSLVVDVANLRLSTPPPPVSAVTPGRSYVDAIRSSPGVSPPAQAGALISAGGSSAPSPSSAAAASPVVGWRGRLAPPSLLAAFPRRHSRRLPPTGSPPPPVIGWWGSSASFLRFFFRVPPPLLPPPLARRATHHPDNWPTSDRQIPAVRPGTFGCRQA
jgi:hypothetical protein